jgi:membrane dipeptidase
MGMQFGGGVCLSRGYRSAMIQSLPRHALSALSLALAFAGPLSAASPEEVAVAALKRSPVVDGHNDVAGEVRNRFDNDVGRFDFRDTTNTGTGGQQVMHTDLARLKKGMVGGQFWSVYVTADIPETEAVKRVTEQIDTVNRLVAKYPASLRMAYTAADIEAAFRSGRIASLIGMEGGHSIGSSLAVLRQMYAAGARYMTLTHNKNTPWADAATDTATHGGLSPFGVAVVKEMNRLGMLVDLSHVSEDTMIDALDASSAPVIFSHSGARAVGGHLRNVPDSVLKRLPANGGVVMVVFLPDFVSEDVRQWAARKAGEEARLAALFRGDVKGAAAALQPWLASNPRPNASIGQVADHIDHIRKLAGIDNIGIGGDYDGMTSAPVGMEDVSGYPALFTELARRGYSQADLEKIASRNIIRALKGAEGAAARLKDQRPGEARLGK